ncbi:hypothetical protein HY988_06160 [Candidatus Micrarchaeota archaeon]|nr:hypothetical protein [Candidatus Micrarchaeota archaeon]
MFRVYECPLNKRVDVEKILESDPYSDDSFARTGYKVKDGGVLGEDKAKLYIYIKAADEFLKKADIRLKGIAEPAPEEVQKRVREQIVKEEEQAESGFGAIFGE